MGIFDKAVANSFYLFLSWFVMATTSYLFWSISSKFLSPSELGIVTTSINLGIILSILTLGTHSAILKLVSEYINQKRIDRIKKIVSASLTITIITWGLASIVIFIGKDVFSNILKIPQSSLFLAVALGFLLSLNGIFTALISAQQNFRRLFFSDSAHSIAKMLVTLYLLKTTASFLGPILGMLSAVILWVGMRLSPSYVSLTTKLKDKELIEYSIPALINIASFALINNSQYLMVSIIKTTDITGIFSIAMIASSVFFTIPNILGSAVFPITSGLSVMKNSIDRQRKLIEYVARYSLLVAIPGIILISIFSKQIVLLFSTAEFIGASKLLPVLSVASLLLGLGGTFHGTIYALKKPKIYGRIIIVVSTVFLLLAPVLTYLHADVGMSIGYLITVMVYFSLSLFYLRKEMKRVSFSGIGKVFLACIIAFGWLIVFSRNIGSVFAILGISALSGVAYLILLALMKFYQEEDFRIVRYFAKNRRVKRVFDFIFGST